jgi:hypothetical protein
MIEGTMQSGVIEVLSGSAVGAMGARTGSSCVFTLRG